MNITSGRTVGQGGKLYVYILALHHILTKQYCNKLVPHSAYLSVCASACENIRTSMSYMSGTC